MTDNGILVTIISIPNKTKCSSALCFVLKGLMITKLSITKQNREIRSHRITSQESSVSV